MARELSGGVLLFTGRPMAQAEGGQRCFPLLRSLLVLLADAALTGGSLLCAMLLRFDGVLPKQGWTVFEQGLPLLLLVRLASLAWLGLHRWSFRRSGLNEAVRLVLANAFATLVFEALRSFSFFEAPPRSVVAIEFILSTALLGFFRFVPRTARLWYLEQKRSRAQGTQRTIVVGAGSAGDLLLHDLLRTPNSSWHVIGLVDDDAAKHGTFLNGKQVIGSIDALPELVARHRVTQVLIAIPS